MNDAAPHVIFYCSRTSRSARPPDIVIATSEEGMMSQKYFPKAQIVTMSYNFESNNALL
jgi:hypothetical protein